MPRYHGFTCLKCGGHQFGTNNYPENAKFLHDESLRGKSIGYCKTSPDKCKFTWDRSSEVEKQVMYEQTCEEFNALCNVAVKEMKEGIGGRINIKQQLGDPPYLPFEDSKITHFVLDAGCWYLSDNGDVIRFEAITAEDAKENIGAWVLRTAEGKLVDRDQFRNDLFDRWNYKLV